MTADERPARPAVVIAGGGTGGHTSPGLAVAAALSSRGITCAWIGSRRGVEAHRAPAHSIPYFAIPTGKLRRYWSWRNLADLGGRRQGRAPSGACGSGARGLTSVSRCEIGQT